VIAGFVRNAISPFGMYTMIPVVVSASAASLRPSYLWLGGGEVDVKLRVPVQQLLSHLHAAVIDCTTSRVPPSMEGDE
jgi:prolyl-tRNA editing enzyme YbaK/EbsC (Cys-tRNA(Pro) deacylase)